MRRAFESVTPGRWWEGLLQQSAIYGEQRKPPERQPAWYHAVLGQRRVFRWIVELLLMDGIRRGSVVPKLWFVVSLHRCRPVRGNSVRSESAPNLRPRAAPHCQVATRALVPAPATAPRNFPPSSFVFLSSFAIQAPADSAPHKCCKPAQPPHPTDIASAWEQGYSSFL